MRAFGSNSRQSDGIARPARDGDILTREECFMALCLLLKRWGKKVVIRRLFSSEDEDWRRPVSFAVAEVTSYARTIPSSGALYKLEQLRRNGLQRNIYWPRAPAFLASL